MINFIEDLFHNHLDHVLDQEPVPDDDEEMNWRLFFAHSQDMQGFAADIFVGGPNERKHPTNPLYVGLRESWPSTSCQLISDLAEVWRDPSCQELLKQLTSHRHQGDGFVEGLLRTHQRDDHNQPDLRRMAERLRRCQDDDGAARPADASLPYRRNRERVVPLPAQHSNRQVENQDSRAKQTAEATRLNSAQVMSPR